MKSYLHRIEFATGAIIMVLLFYFAFINYRPLTMSPNANSEVLGMSTIMRAHMGYLDSSNGDDFDRAYLSKMIVLHQQILRATEGVETNAKHPELKKFAIEMKTMEAKELQQMQKWNDEWGY